ncbi:DUF397 domain-containing protein [Streptomyces bambusae]|uniref:DUF397 domain-containing protein n=1 Tax=Streptomyces bambusae TaxID=1550616 RepID=A0ABS6Z191_9ACTN|nr:DUF397 domain-containing protein [Streptomyces bambusae]MBW5481508.1 DUF397 domain-containing protein [Streptomyces bambusae]
MSTQTPESSDTPQHWHKSSYSGSNSNCVEVAATADGGRAVRDSKDAARPGIHATAAAWTAFLDEVKRTPGRRGRA